MGDYVLIGFFAGMLVGAALGNLIPWTCIGISIGILIGGITSMRSR